MVSPRHTGNTSPPTAPRPDGRGEAVARLDRHTQRLYRADVRPGLSAATLPGRTDRHLRGNQDGSHSQVSENRDRSCACRRRPRICRAGSILHSLKLPGENHRNERGNTFDAFGNSTKCTSDSWNGELTAASKEFDTEVVFKECKLGCSPSYETSPDSCASSEWTTLSAHTCTMEITGSQAMPRKEVTPRFAFSTSVPRQSAI